MNDSSVTPLPSPATIHSQFPLTASLSRLIATFRHQSTHILQRKDPRIALLVGPCSIHNPIEALEYARRLKELQKEVAPHFFLILRTFLEKPRTLFGWKGLLYDPHLDGSHAMEEGIKISRKLLLDLAELGVPTATELLDPLAAPYFCDLLTWGVIGARTATSQPHRQLASSLPFPIGFKNTIYGELEPSIFGVSSSRKSHSALGINLEGRIAAIQTRGNPWTHLILRGSHHGPNADPASIRKALDLLKLHHLEPTLGIDCSHGNSGKDLQVQSKVFEETFQLAKKEFPEIRMMMLESYLTRGHQKLSSHQNLAPGLSITDPCLSWEETVKLLLQPSVAQ